MNSSESRREGQTALRGLWFGAAAASALIVAANALTPAPSAGRAVRTGADTSAATRRMGDGPGRSFDQPCDGAEETPLDVVRRLATIPVTTATPDHSQFTAAYFCSGGPATPALAYGAVYLTYETGWVHVDLDKGWAERIRRENGRPYVTTFHGDPALVDPADPADAQAIPEILVVRGDYLIRVQGEPGAAIQPLLDVANHLGRTPSLA
ncbi:hypothetical protein [Nocardioides marmorisolisilvae]|uniref:hypothetical protein n=1 Tax=Nocardioides marmorisolisilvae TaxID=1542737 RepID=UPI0011CE1693|nr:hypothetical protein [Nocardioides marmorisolisilvae]